MKLAAKLILVFLLGVLAIVSMFAWQTIQRQRLWDEQRRSAHAADLAETLTPAIEEAYKKGGTITVQQALEISTRQLSGPQVRWIDRQEVTGNAASQTTETTSRQTTSLTITDADGNRKSYSYVPMQIGDENAGTVEIAEPLADQDAFTRRSFLTSVLLLIGVAILSAAVIFFGGITLVGRPLSRLIAQVNQIGAGKVDLPPALTSNDELGRLALAISEMSHRIGRQRDTIRHTDRLGTIGTLAAGMAHELGTPLNVVAGRAGLIKSGKLNAEEVASSAATIQSEAERMTVIIRQLLDFARQKPSAHHLLELNDLVGQTCEVLRPLAAKSNVEMIVDLPDEIVSIDGDPAQVQQVLTNLITNAVAAMPNGGVVTVTLAQRADDLVQNQLAEIRVTDGGVGIDPQDVERIFEPFYTTKDVGQGTGLGLSIAYGIVREHGGNLRFDRAPERGSQFTVTFPVFAPE
ncbi:sensor histidine kinase [Allorhodopirellula heiligendammensis]|uniref:histidine kinase n=1 Tax=Allorhodopirellula heiligendammensis TaxID=2714739 RepID=A0A5C6C1B0_9BACT|nr:HAMP domain-containing sensor histidine kinase [Allorhodopirellula heiligendammensis]TWU18363.1 Sporulation kinase E [Allorhodopirellula heiligendammensis]